jgi:hypothetical protein
MRFAVGCYFFYSPQQKIIPQDCGPLKLENNTFYLVALND